MSLSSTKFNNLSLGTFTVTNQDDGFSVLVGALNGTVAEGGSTATYTLQLTQTPTGNVSITVNGGTNY